MGWRKFVSGSIRGGSAALMFGALITAGAVAAQPPRSETSDLDREIKRARAEYHQRLESLAKVCAKQEMPDEAATTRSRIIEQLPDRQTIFLPPATGIAVADSATDLHRAWARQLEKIGDEHAGRLIELANRAADESHGATGYQLLHEALVAAPDHAEIRGILGFRRDGGGWTRTLRPIRVSRGQRRQAIIGWEKGDYQIVQSPHFTISTPDGEAGRQLAIVLETTYDVWRQVWFELWSGDRQLRSWLGGDGSDSSGSQRHDVILFANREQYLRDLADVSNIELSTGYYNDEREVSFFYHDSPAPLDTWRHEIVHQLMREKSPGKRSMANASHAWLVEGTAMYFESMREFTDRVTLGGFDAQRLQFARLRFTREGFFRPLEELHSLDRTGLQESGEVHALYSQSAGMCQFLFNGEGGRYREGLIRFVRDFYRDPDGELSLADTAAPFDQLDREYREFLKVTRDDLRNLEARDPIGLALAGAGIRGDDLRALSACQSLEWLQLSENPIGDDGIRHLAGLPKLRELMIDVTGISDAGLEQLGTIGTLEQLDLASTPISDAGLKHLARLPLKVLWLGGTGITDTGIAHLALIKSLEYLDLRQTRVTDAGVARLRDSIPDLRVER